MSDFGSNSSLARGPRSSTSTAAVKTTADADIGACSLEGLRYGSLSVTLPTGQKLFAWVMNPAPKRVSSCTGGGRFAA